ncbi:MAG: VWA domain-containing protein [Alphaproteobacteria bacterium]|nr:VWA domain-containing protein [Alphaproteobacteria bacterium]
MGRNISLVLGISMMTLAGCEVIQQALASLSEIELLGVVPDQNFSNTGTAGYGKVRFAIGGRDDLGQALAPFADEIEITSDDGQNVDETPGDQVDGHTAGSFLFLVDGSGSTEADLTCDGCPTDPNRLRVEATKALAQELGYCGGGWRMSLMEFGGYPDNGFSATHVLSDWTTDDDALEAAADGLSSYSTTPLWDSLYETLDALAADEPTGTTTVADSGIDLGGERGRGLVVASDGTDNVSSHTIDDVVAKATSLGIPVHAIGFGPASDSDANPNDLAVQALQKLAGATGGTYGFVSTVEDLPALTTAIAGAMCGGYTEVEGTFDEPPPSGDTVTGSLRLKGAPSIGVPYTFRAP